MKKGEVKVVSKEAPDVSSDEYKSKATELKTEVRPYVFMYCIGLYLLYFKNILICIFVCNIYIYNV